MFDLNIKGNSYDTNLILAKQASKYGWKHINFAYNQNDYNNALIFKNDVQKALNGSIDIDYTLNIESNNPNEIRKITRKFRHKTSCISVLGGNLKVNRTCLENVQIDVLSKPYFKRYDAGINHILAKQAKDNNVAIELQFCDILKSYSSHRSKILSNFRDIIKLHNKYDFPLILSSGADSIFDIKTVHDFKSVFKQCGLSDVDIEKSFNVSENIINFNKNRKNMIMAGVKVVK